MIVDEFIDYQNDH